MTLAICLRCGHEKVGAFTACPACGYDPSDDAVARAKALLLSDQHATPDELRAASVMIKAGEEVPFARSMLGRVVAEVGKGPRLAKKLSVWRMFVWSPIGFVILLAVLEVMNVFFLWVRGIWVRH